VDVQLFINDAPYPHRATFNVYNLVTLVLHRDFEFPQLLRVFTLSQATFEPNELLGEAEVLKDIAKVTVRPYIDVGRPLEQIDLDGLVHFPQLLRPEGQIVRDWNEFVELADGNVGLVSTPPTLVASKGKLHLVDAVAIDVAEAPAWNKLPHVSAETFRWDMGQLLADGMPQMDVPDEFRRKPGAGWLEVKFAQVPVYLAWATEIDELIDACREAIAKRATIRTRME
jgi:hypothetical protein